MKIAVITSFWKPPRFRGGISRVMFELRKRWINGGHTVHVYAPDAVGNRAGGIFRTYVPPLPFRSVWLNARIALAGGLKDYDVVFPQTGIMALFMNRKKCIPFIHTLSRVEHPSRWRVWRRAFAPLERYALKNLPLYITFCGDANQGLMTDYGIPATKIRLVNNGVDYDVFRPGDAPAREAFIVLSAGRFIPRKRFDLLIKSFALFAGRCKNAKLVIAGDGNLNVRLKQLASKLGIASKVSFPGMVDEGMMLKLYQSASVYVLPSVAEGMPMVALEAQSCGLPVIAGDFAFTSAVVLDEKTGLLVKGDDPVQWAEALGRIHENTRLRRTLGMAGREHVIKSFTWDQTADRIMTGFEMVLKESMSSNLPGNS